MPVYFLFKRKMYVNLRGWEGREDMGRIWGREILMRIFYMKPKSIFNKRKNEQLIEMENPFKICY